MFHASRPREGLPDTLSKLFNMSKVPKGAEFVGEDCNGNKYYKSRNPAHPHYDRWIEPLKGKADYDASEVPPEWHMWLHHMVDEDPISAPPTRSKWSKEHKKNTTGTMDAYRPKRFLFHGKRVRDTPVTEWDPSSSS